MTLAASRRTSGFGAGGWCSGVGRPMAPMSSCVVMTNESTPRSVPSTTSRGRRNGARAGAGPVARAGSDAARRASPAGWATSAATSRRGRAGHAARCDRAPRPAQLLLEPELLATIEPDLHLVTLLVELNQSAARRNPRHRPRRGQQRARRARAQAGDRTRTAVDGALARADRTRRPRPGDIDWLRTVHANLRH